MWATSGNLLSSADLKAAPAPVEKRRVSFQPQVRVVLIPCRNEYAEADLLVTLWWEDSDYTSFKTDAVLELKRLMVSRNIRSSKEAIKIMYQPVYTNPADTIAFNGLEAVTPYVDQMTDKMDKNNVRVTAGVDEPKMRLIEARTDLDLTDLKRHGAEIETKTIHVHPLAYMCP